MTALSTPLLLGTFRAGDGNHVAVPVGDELADLTAVPDGPRDLIALLGDPDARRTVQRLARSAPRVPAASAWLGPPVRPPKFLAIGLNAREHARDVNVRWLLREPSTVRMFLGYGLAHPRPRHPFFFAKATSCVAGPTDPIWLPTGTRMVDFEGELAVVIGHRLRRGDVRAAQAAIAGYTVTNDVSVRDWQKDNPTGPTLAKGFETHGPLGPFLAIAGDVDPGDLTLTTHVNGERRQQGRIADLIRSPAEIVSILSTFCTLEPGDVICCGTFAGTAWPTGRFLRDGDRVRVEIDGIGAIDNPVVAEPT